MRIIGFAGTAKNTGKTTTALAVLAQCVSANLATALTSIGFDGENRDHVTGLPKPRYNVGVGALIATAQKLLRVGSAVVEIRETTAIQTIFGPIMVAEVTKPGTVVLAGPNRQSDLAVVAAIFERLGADVTLVDGALNRLVPLIGTDALVLSTGAAFDERIPVIAEHAAALASLWSPPTFAITLPASLNIQILYSDGATAEIPGGSLLSESAQANLLHSLHHPVHRLVIPFACHPRLLGLILERLPGSQLVLGDPLKCIASGDPLNWQKVWQDCSRLGVTPSYLHSVPVRLMTVNPFFPRFIASEHRYEPAYVNSAELVEAVQVGITLFPVMDIRQPPEPNFIRLLDLSPKEQL